MANLTGNKIRNTFDQVANLSGPVSTTFQTLTDGVGNDMGLEFKDDTVNVRTGFSFTVNGLALSTTLEGLSDTSFAGLADDDILVYNGTNWVNETVATVETKFNHDNLTGFVADEHIAHAGVSVIAASNSGLLAANNTLSSNIGLAVDINGSTSKATPISADEIMLYDTIGTANKKATFAQVEAILNHDNLAGFVSNEHIDWTSASSDLSTSGTIESSSTSHIGLATGTTGQRPGSPATGDGRFNTTDSKWEVYNGSGWDQYAISAGSGETNTASNSGVSGVGVYARKTGADLEFKNITVDSNMTITDDTGNDEIDIALNVGTLPVADAIQHTGDTNNQIVLGTDTQDYQTGGSSRLDISNSGVRLGAANARVTTVLDEDTMSSDSATALATQQSIKAYVDAASPSGEAFSATTSTAQVIGSASFTKVQLGTEVFDTGGTYDSVTNYRWTPDVAGKYVVAAGVSYGSATDAMLLIAAIYKNGANYRSGFIRTSGTGTQGATVSTVVDMNGTTDYIELYTYQDSGSNKSLFTSSAYNFLEAGRILE
jgi:hypothetical protein